MSVELTRIVLSGGPGSGKTTVLQGLQGLGYRTVEESGRLIIQQEVLDGGSALPWADREAFAERMLQHALHTFKVDGPEEGGLLFFDRGMVDVVGYCRLEGLPVSDSMLRAAQEHRYSKVILFPPWQEIYAKDEERKQDFDEAERTYTAMLQAYTECGYEYIVVPRLPLTDRLSWIIDKVS